MYRATVTTVAELLALPPRSVVVAHFGDGSQPDFTAIRSFAEGVSSATTDSLSIMGTDAWTELAGWGATLLVEHDAGAVVYIPPTAPMA